jgi:hypothetical protein
MVGATTVLTVKGYFAAPKCCRTLDGAPFRPHRDSDERLPAETLPGPARPNPKQKADSS